MHGPSVRLSAAYAAAGEKNRPRPVTGRDPEQSLAENLPERSGGPLPRSERSPSTANAFSMAAANISRSSLFSQRADPQAVASRTGSGPGCRRGHTNEVIPKGLKELHEQLGKSLAVPGSASREEAANFGLSILALERTTKTCKLRLGRVSRFNGFERGIRHE